MKFLLKKYRIISIWMSLLILTLAFVAGSDQEWRPVSLTLAFLTGTFLYGLGGIREWMLDRRVSSMVEMALAFCMLIAVVLCLLGFGGLL